MAKLSEKTDFMGRQMLVCDKCEADVDNLTPVDAEDFNAFTFTSKGYTRVAETARRVCDKCVRGHRREYEPVTYRRHTIRRQAPYGTDSARAGEYRVTAPDGYDLGWAATVADGERLVDRA